MKRPWSYDDELIARDEVNAYRAWKLGMSSATCTCSPCETPQYGVPGHPHCAACCYGSLIAEYDHQCPITEHQAMARRQFGPTSQVNEDPVT